MKQNQNPSARAFAPKLPTTEIRQRIKEGNVKPKIGDKVLVTRADGTQYLAEVLEIHADIKDWILKVKKVDDDGITSVQEVSNLVVDAVIIVQNIILSDVFRAFSQWVKNLFRKKPKAALTV
jgi:hypothetical protein